MNTGDALKILIDAGWVTKEEAKKIADKASADEKMRKARSVAERALVDYLFTITKGIPREEHEDFVRIMFDELEKDLKKATVKEKEPDPDDDEVIRKFLKAIGAA